jgi:hypothetical protein
MDRFRWEEEKEQRRAEYLKQHAQMARLFVEDRLAFERERKRFLDEFFDSIENEDVRRRLRALQTSFEEKMKHAGSPHNRFVLAQILFWDHFHKTWQPGIEKMNAQLRSLVTKMTSLHDPA